MHTYYYPSLFGKTERLYLTSLLSGFYMKPVSILLVLLVSITASGQTTEEEHAAWLDSVQSETFIAAELNLDELVVAQPRDESAARKTALHSGGR